MENIVTYKIKYECEEKDKEIILSFIRSYNNCLKFTYNRLLENNYTTKELTNFQRNLNNIIIYSHFKNSSIFEAKGLISKFKTNKICFGGKAVYNRFNSGLITKEELQLGRLVPLFSVGESSHKGNRKFQLLSNAELLFKPNKNLHITLNLQKQKNRIKDLNKLIVLQNNKEISITYKLDLNYIYITFDLNKVREVRDFKKVNNRVFAIDLNPNYVGYSVVDWKNESKYKVISSGVISIKKINDKDFKLKSKGYSSESKERKYLSNKRNFEVEQIGIKLAKLAVVNNCELFAMEDLSIKSKDNKRGKSYNKLVNNCWNRNRLTFIIEKYCKLSNLQLQKVMANYSSFIGNLVFREKQLPDMVLSSIEIGRRAYEFNLQYIMKIKQQKKNIVFPDLELVKGKVVHALEVLDYFESFKSLKELYYSLKNLKIKYRVPLEKINSRVFSLFYKKSYINLYNFI